jgi:predicted RNase H-like nuclease
MLLGDLRTIIDEGRLLLPKEGVWAEVRKQLLGYKLEDRKIVQDAVMALVCAVSLLRRTPVDGETSVAFDVRDA